MDRATSAVLLRRAREGSPDALDALFRECGERLLALIRLRLGAQLRREVESRDILQATFLRAFERLDQFDGSGRTTLMGWLAAIARHEILNQAQFQARQRRDARQRVTLDASRGIVAERVHSETSRIALKDDARRLERAMARLAADHREVILLRQYEELGFREIGERLQRSEDAARMLFARAMTALSLEMKALRREKARR